MLEQNFQEYIDDVGEPQGGAVLTSEQLGYVREHLPSSLAGFLEEFGFGGYFANGWQLCDPLKFRTLAALIFKADPDLNHNNTHIIGFSAFGTLAVWSEKHWDISVDLLQYEVECFSLAKPILNVPLPPPPISARPVNDISMASNILPFDNEVREFWDRDGRPLFSRCVKKYGKLELGECYGFVPSLGATGYNSKFRYLEYIQRLSALEHFMIISQFKPFHLTRLNMGNNEIIREIG